MYAPSSTTQKRRSITNAFFHPSKKRKASMLPHMRDMLRRHIRHAEGRSKREAASVLQRRKEIVGWPPARYINRSNGRRSRSTPNRLKNYDEPSQASQVENTAKKQFREAQRERLRSDAAMTENQAANLSKNYGLGGGLQPRRCFITRHAASSINVCVFLRDTLCGIRVDYQVAGGSRRLVCNELSALVSRFHR